MPVHILIADDEEDLQYLLNSKFKERIKSGEWVFYSAKNGMEALALFERHPEIELVLTDLNMPVMDGLALLGQLQLKERLVQAVVVSAYGDIDNIRKAMNRGAFDFIVKPINLNDLEATLLKTLDHISFLKETRMVRQQLVEAKRELDFSKELARLKSHFFANISHEFRTPLTLITGPLQDILHGAHGEVSGKVQKNLAIMHQHANRLKHLVDQLLDIARLEAGKLPLHVRKTDFVAFVRDQVKAFQPAAEQAGITLEFQQTLPELGVCFDADHFEKVINNLVSNALKWTSGGGRIRVQAGQASDRAFLQVRDNGKGIPADALPFIFDRFYRVDDATGQMQGTGIGLALTKELVALHCGEITVESESGFGSRFTVYIPLGDAHFDEVAFLPAASKAPATFDAMTESESFEEEAEGDVTASTGRHTVLLVEDQPDVRAYVSSLLKRYYHVLEAANGHEALLIIASAAPALVVSDVMMPDMDGFELCKAIKEDERLSHIPVILLTAKAEDEDRLDGLASGADDYIVKPFNARELLVRAENLITIRQLLREKFASGYVLQASTVSVSSADEVFLEGVRVQIEKEMCNPNFDVGQLADAVALSPRQLRRRIRELTGLSASGLVRSLRLQRAAQLLEQHAGTVSEIAYQVGFQQVKYFSHLFKQVYGVNPSSFG